jgi:hypothetical protein
MALDLGADLHESCLRISPIHSDYATLPIQTGFDWSPLHGCVFDELYLVVFRSARRPDADLVLLRKYDDHAYEEAIRSGGLLRYFKGHANDRGECLSFCLWQTREQAREAAGAASHKSAAGITALTYISYTLDRYWLKKPGMALTFERIRSELREQPLALSSQPKS